MSLIELLISCSILSFLCGVGMWVDMTMPAQALTSLSSTQNDLEKQEQLFLKASFDFTLSPDEKF